MYRLGFVVAFLFAQRTDRVHEFTQSYPRCLQDIIFTDLLELGQMMLQTGEKVNNVYSKLKGIRQMRKQAVGLARQSEMGLIPPPPAEMLRQNRPPLPLMPNQIPSTGMNMHGNAQGHYFMSEVSNTSSNDMSLQIEPSQDYRAVHRVDRSSRVGARTTYAPPLSAHSQYMSDSSDRSNVGGPRLEKSTLIESKQFNPAQYYHRENRSSESTLKATADSNSKNRQGAKQKNSDYKSLPPIGQTIEKPLLGASR